MKHIMISIRPEWAEKILNREKILEIRKSFPKEECIVELYCTKGQELWGDGTGNTWHGIAEDEDLERVFELNPTLARLNGKVVARWHLNKYDLLIDYGAGIHFADKDYNLLDLDYLRTNACLTDEQIYLYLGLKKNSGYYNDGYAWHIDNLEIYETPKELSEFGLTRAPQSWQYLEDTNEVTIAEGDLQQQLAEKDNEIEALKEETKMLKSWKETYYKNWQKAKKELEEMRFRERNLGGLIEKVSSKGQQQIRHQVCEEIKHKLAEKRLLVYFKDTKDVLNYPRKAVCWEDVVLRLNQVEKGE